MELETFDETEMDDAVSDSSEQLLTVVNVVIMDEMGADVAAADEVAHTIGVCVELVLVTEF